MTPQPQAMNAPRPWAHQPALPKMAAGLLALSLTFFKVLHPAQAEPAPLQTVPSVDVPRYMGT
ncbi:MAG: hypothetical protein KAY21_10740, partial [Limnohabitans sp.]|nr:hypothetical protein [Limnohabitans sp.]